MVSSWVVDIHPSGGVFLTAEGLEVVAHRGHHADFEVVFTFLEVVGDVKFIVLAEVDFLIVVVIVFAVVGVVSDWLVVLIIVVLVRVFQGGVGLDFLFDALFEFD